MGEISLTKTYIRFSKDSQFCQELIKLYEKFNLGYVRKNFLGYSIKARHMKIEDIINSRKGVSLEKVIKFYKKLKEKENPNVNIFNWIDEAEECITSTRIKVDKIQLIAYLERVI